MSEPTAEVLIVGGGVVGLTLALALGRAGVPVALVEAKPVETDWPAGTVDLRVYAMTRASQRLFDSLGVWAAIRDAGISPFQEMYVWDAGGQGHIHFDAAELGQPWLGAIIESRVIVRALFEALQALPSVRLYIPQDVVDFHFCNDLQRVDLANGESLSARLLVGADGAGSRLRDAAAIHVQQQSYGQKALVTVVETALSHQATAWQRFLPSGPLAFLPLRDGRSSIVWSATSQLADQLQALPEVEFCQCLGEAFEHRLGDILACTERVLFPLTRQHARDYVKAGVALVGDAAHVIHPLAGLGVNQGLNDVQALAEVIIRATQTGRNPGSYATLRRYERARKTDNLLVMSAMDAFKQLFGTSAPPLRWARNTGMNLVDRLVPLKNMIARRAMGLD